MTAEILTPKPGALVIKITGAASTAGGGLGSVPNPEGADLLITKTTLYIETASTGAANLDVGIDSSAADSTDIINALAVNGAVTDKYYNGHARQNTAKTEITAPAHWDADDYINFTGSASTAGLVAYLLVEYYHKPS